MTVAHLAKLRQAAKRLIAKARQTREERLLDEAARLLDEHLRACTILAAHRRGAANTLH